jgi:hypothetical protein
MTSANNRKSCRIVHRCRVPCFWTSGLGACHHPPGWFHFHISSILSHVFPSITVCIILPRLERIRPRIRILFRRIVKEWYKVFDVKNICYFDMAGQLQLICVGVDLLHNLNRADFPCRQLVVLTAGKTIFSYAALLFALIAATMLQFYPEI